MDRRSKKWIRYLKLLGCCVLCGFLLAGCTARDLEERRFPMALELSSAGEELVLSCAWAENSQKNNEVEEADQPDITRVTAQTVQEALQKVQSLQDKYVDYSQVKAIVWHDSLPEQSALGKQALAWLEETPELARNILVFLVPDGELELDEIQKEARGRPGVYLENLYKNSGLYQNQAFTLTELLYRRPIVSE